MFSVLCETLFTGLGLILSQGPASYLIELPIRWTMSSVVEKMGRSGWGFYLREAAVGAAPLAPSREMSLMLSPWLPMLLGENVFWQRFSGDYFALPLVYASLHTAKQPHRVNVCVKTLLPSCFIYLFFSPGFLIGLRIHALLPVSPLWLTGLTAAFFGQKEIALKDCLI